MKLSVLSILSVISVVALATSDANQGAVDSFGNAIFKRQDPDCSGCYPPNSCGGDCHAQCEGCKKFVMAKREEHGGPVDNFGNPIFKRQEQIDCSGCYAPNNCGGDCHTQCEGCKKA